MRRTSDWTVTATMMGLLLVTSAVARQVEPTAEGESPAHRMSGIWVLDEELSEDPREAMRGQMRSRGGGGRGGFAAGARAGSGRRGGRAGGPGGRDGEGRGGGRAQQLVLEVGDDLVSLSGPGGRTQSFPLAEKPAVGVATWKGEKLVVRVERPQGGKVTRRFVLSDDGTRLVVTTTLPARGGGQGVTFDSVYDRQGAETEDPPL